MPEETPDTDVASRVIDESLKMDRLIEQSSLGTACARQLRKRVPERAASAVIEKVAAASDAGPVETPTSDIDVLAQRAAGGDAAAMELCIGAVLQLALRYCEGRMGGRDVGGLSPVDVAQEISIAVLKALPRHQSTGGQFLPLVFSIANHKIADAYRVASRDKSAPGAALPDRVEDAAGPEDVALRTELRERMTWALGKLSMKQREVIVLRVMVGLSAEETGTALGMTAGQVRVMQHRTLSRLRVIMADSPDL